MNEFVGCPPARCLKLLFLATAWLYDFLFITGSHGRAGFKQDAHATNDFELAH